MVCLFDYFLFYILHIHFLLFILQVHLLFSQFTRKQSQVGCLIFCLLFNHFLKLLFLFQVLGLSLHFLPFRKFPCQKRFLSLPKVCLISSLVLRIQSYNLFFLLFLCFVDAPKENREQSPIETLPLGTIFIYISSFVYSTSQLNAFLQPI